MISWSLIYLRKYSNSPEPSSDNLHINDAFSNISYEVIEDSPQNMAALKHYFKLPYMVQRTYKSKGLPWWLSG